ncbi:hypothetical protein J3Q64DRAFT_1664832, partial [Phycomyces blakesleeanus]
MSHYNTHSTTHSPHPAQTLSTPQQAIYTNPGDISNIVHSPAVSVPELPTTLPPLNTTILNSPSTHSPPRMPTAATTATPTATPTSAAAAAAAAAAATYSPALHNNRQMDMLNSRQKVHERPVWAEDDSILRVSQDPSVLAQFQHATQAAATLPQQTRRGQMNYDQQPQPSSSSVPELSPYGCGVPGCFTSFPLSSGLFYHMKSTHPNIDDIEKPFRCAMPNCQKRYKNINGLQYHLREAKGSSSHGLTLASNEDGSHHHNLGGIQGAAAQKQYSCIVPGCKKAYRTTNGLRYHQTHGHNVQGLGSDPLLGIPHQRKPRSTQAQVQARQQAQAQAQAHAHAQAQAQAQAQA